MVFTFEKLIDPISSDSFFANYWQQAPHIIERENSAYYAPLMSLATVDKLLFFGQFQPHQIKLVRKAEILEVPTPLQLNWIYRKFSEGYSLVLHGLDRRHPPITELAMALERTLCHPVGINMYLTPKGSEAFSPHYDVHDVFVLQVLGSKRWFIHDKGFDLPLAENVLGNANIQTNALMETILQQGDLLYLPRGFVHRAVAEDNLSMHLTVGIHGVRWRDMVIKALDIATAKDRRFREFLPIGAHGQDFRASDFQEHFAKLLNSLADQATLDEALAASAETHFKARPTPPDGHFVSLNNIQELTLDTELHRRNHGHTRIIQHQDSLEFFFSGNVVRMPSSIRPALDYMLEHASFSVRSLPDILTNDSKQILARRMVAEGFLAINS